MATIAGIYDADMRLAVCRNEMGGAAVAGVWVSIRIGIGPDVRRQPSFTWWVINRLAFLVAAAVAWLVVGLWGGVTLLLAAQVFPWRRKLRKGNTEPAPATPANPTATS